MSQILTHLRAQRHFKTKGLQFPSDENLSTKTFTSSFLFSFASSSQTLVSLSPIEKEKEETLFLNNLYTRKKERKKYRKEGRKLLLAPLAMKHIINYYEKKRKENCQFVYANIDLEIEQNKDGRK